MPTMSSSLRPALGDALHRVEDQRARQPVHRGVLVVVAVHVQNAVLGFERDALGDQRRDLALGAFDQNRVALDFVLDARGQRDRLLSNTRHRFNPSLACESRRSIMLLRSTAAREAVLSDQPQSTLSPTRNCRRHCLDGCLTKLRRAASPPTPSRRAWRPVITPLGVVMIEMPRPPCTRLISSRPM